MSKIDGGGVFWARQTIESEIFFKKPDKWFKIWFYLVLKAKWQDEKGLKRGQCYMKYDWITDETGANRNEIDHCIRWLKRAKQIATVKATRGFIITIQNYERFQDLDNYKSDTKSDMKSEVKATQKRHRSDRILKKGNKENKEKEIVLPSWLEKEIWISYIDHRKTMKAEMTPRAKELALQKLQKFHDAGQDAKEIIEQTIMNGWKGLFEISLKTKIKNEVDDCPYH